MSAATVRDEKSILLAELRGAAALIVSDPGNEGAYLDVIARRVYGVEQYHKCSVEDLRSMLPLVRRRAQAEPIPGVRPDRLHVAPAIARRMSGAAPAALRFLGVSARALGTCESGQPIPRPAAMPATVARCATSAALSPGRTAPPDSKANQVRSGRTGSSS